MTIWIFPNKTLKHTCFVSLLRFFLRCISCWCGYYADSSNNQKETQANEFHSSGAALRLHLNAVVVVTWCLCFPPLLSLTGLRGLTSVIGWRMEAHYKISAPCLSIRVTERGLVAVPCHSELSTSRLTKPRVSMFCRRRGGGGQNQLRCY